MTSSDEPQPATGPPVVSRDEAAAALGARQELGPEMEPAVIDAFVDRVERAVDARMAARPAERRAPAPTRRSANSNQLALAIVSLGVSIPLTAIALNSPGGVFAFVIVWMGIVAVNVALAVRRS